MRRALASSDSRRTFFTVFLVSVVVAGLVSVVVVAVVVVAVVVVAAGVEVCAGAWA
jgi:hypothetical protein